MSERRFRYGQSSGQSVFGAVFMAVFAVVLILALRGHTAESGEGWSFGMSVGAVAAGLSMLGAVALVFQSRDPQWYRSEGLSLTDTGIDYRPKMLFMRDVIVTYDTVRKLEIVNEEGTVDLKIKHAVGTITLHRMWFEDRAEFEAFATLVSQRSGQELERGRPT